MLNQKDLKELNLPLAARKRILNYQESVKRDPEAASLHPLQTVVNDLQSKYWGTIGEQQRMQAQQQGLTRSDSHSKFRIQDSNGHNIANTSANQNIIPLQSPHNHYSDRDEECKELAGEQEGYRNNLNSSTFKPILSNSPTMLRNQNRGEQLQKQDEQDDSSYKRYKRSDDTRKLDGESNRFADFSQFNPKRLRQKYQSRMKDIEDQQKYIQLNKKTGQALDHLAYAKEIKTHQLEPIQPLRKYLSQQGDEEDEDGYNEEDSIKQMRVSAPQMHQKSQDRRNYTSADSKYFKKIAKKYSSNDRLKSPDEQMHHRLSASLKTRPSSKTNFINTPNKFQLKPSSPYHQSPSFSASTKAQSPNYL